ncbi:unnamed protein product [Phaedon cochleariae]|uniref:TBC1 domain family member 31 n=1 Tax=Phaedon cochleariae TaxID=80249 RepID=A0A9N9X5W9_PHACE|nr:unnamed protein product [Phaedon cochleariae]
MDVSVPIIVSSEITKKLFKLKPSRYDGLLLTIHHSTRDRKIRFIHVCYHENGNILVSADNQGNSYIFNLLDCKFWALPKVDSCTFITFSSLNPYELLIAEKQGAILIVDIDSGLVVGKLIGHKKSVKFVSFSKKKYCLSSSPYEAIVWNLQTRSKIQVLDLDKTNLLKYVGFLPVSGNIIACFQDDLIQVWSFGKFETLKQFLPSNWKNHTVKSITFTKNGEIMVVSGYLSTLAVFHLGNWKLLKLISLPDNIHTIRHTEFLSQPFDGGCNKILVVLSGQGSIHFFDIEQNVILSQLASKSEIINAVCSPNGNFMACTLCSGEVEVYNLEQYVASPIDVKVQKPSKNAKVSRRCLGGIEMVKEKIDHMLTNEKLKSVLKEYGEFPQTHRLKIWEKLLQLPNNIQQYNSIINHVTLMAFKDLNSNYPLESKLSLKDLKKLLNNIVTWCPFFANVDYFPVFAYPFVKVFQNKPLACFEAICTIILNWCQHWFEYFPLPPVNILAMVENLLMEHDPELLHHFATNDITSNIYIWPLLETAFSEVLTSSEWLIFWDHVLINEVSFLLCASAAYSIVQRNILISLKQSEEFQYFFHNQNPVDMKKFLKITYCILNSTSERIHPRQYLQPFGSIEEGNYPLFIEYPRTIVEFETDRMKQLDGELTELEGDKKKFMEQEKSKKLDKSNNELQKEQSRRMEELKKLCEERLDIMEKNVRREQKEFQEIMKQHEATTDDHIKNIDIGENRIKQQNDTSIKRNINGTCSDRHRRILEVKEKYLTQLKDLLKYKYVIDQVLKHPESVPSDYDNDIMMRKYEKLVEHEMDKIDKSVASLQKLKKMNMQTSLKIIDDFITNIEDEIKMKKSESLCEFPGKKVKNSKRVISNDPKNYSTQRNSRSLCCCAESCPKTVRFWDPTGS